MNLKIEIKDNKNTSTYTVDFAPTEDKIKEVARTISAFVRSISPKVVKETKETIVGSDK